jgi:hypothetical protein
MKPVSVRSTQPETYPLTVHTPHLSSDPAPSRSIQRLLLLLGILLSILFLLVAAAFLVGCVLVSRAIQDIDLSAIRVILEAARHSAIHVEHFTAELEVAVSEGVSAINQTTQSLVRLNNLLESPRMTVSLV